MRHLRIKEISTAVGGTMSFDNAANAEGFITDVCTDTRALKEDCLFVALKGENFDGHDFAAYAVKNGAAAVLTQKPTGCGKEIIVSDTRKALLELAGYYRRLFDIPVVGVTGSVGKTTIKEMTFSVLSKRYKTLKNEGNLNNEIGLPRTVFNLNYEHDAAILEMGMSALGEISRLSTAAAPTVAIIGNIGVSHLENLGTRENILKAKLEILDGMEPDAPLILNGDDPYLYNARIKEHPVFYYGIENKFCRFKAYDIKWYNGGCGFVLDYGCGEQEVFLPVMGRHNILNALAAFSAGYLLGVSPSDAAKALSEYTPEGMRQRIRSVNGITFIEDCYNASPDSMRAALSTLSEISAQRRIAVLGDMLELGSVSDEAHIQTGEFCGKNKVDILMTYGENMKLAAKAAIDSGVNFVRSFSDKNEMARELIATLKEGDAVLFKASRAMRLEDILKQIYESYES